MNYFAQFPDVYEKSIPLLTDNNSNYWCAYLEGEFRYSVWHFWHDDLNLEVQFHRIADLMDAINANEDCWDFWDLAKKLGLELYGEN